MSNLNPQGYNYGIEPKNINPFWGKEGGSNDVWRPKFQSVEDGTRMTWEMSSEESAPTPVVIRNGVDGKDGADGATPNITATATVDATTGTPSVTVSKSGTTEAPTINFAFTGLKGETGATGAQGEQGIRGEQGIQGETGATGATPIITANASVDATTGTPAVTVSKTGTAEAPVLNFSFTGLKGETGATGETGAQGVQGNPGVNGETPIITATAQVDQYPGTPAVTVSKSGTDLRPVFNFAFEGIKGEPGEGGGGSGFMPYQRRNFFANMTGSLAFLAGQESPFYPVTPTAQNYLPWFHQSDVWGNISGQINTGEDILARVTEALGNYKGLQVSEMYAPTFLMPVKISNIVDTGTVDDISQTLIEGTRFLTNIKGDHVARCYVSQWDQSGDTPVATRLVGKILIPDEISGGMSGVNSNLEFAIYKDPDNGNYYLEITAISMGMFTPYEWSGTVTSGSLTTALSIDITFWAPYPESNI